VGILDTQGWQGEENTPSEASVKGSRMNICRPGIISGDRTERERPRIGKGNGPFAGDEA